MHALSRHPGSFDGRWGTTGQIPVVARGLEAWEHRFTEATTGLEPGVYQHHCWQEPVLRCLGCRPFLNF